MIAKPSASCSSVMHSGGFVWIELLAIIVYRPFSRRNLPIAFISSLVPLNGVSGVHGSRDPDEVEDPEQPEVAGGARPTGASRPGRRGGGA